MRIPNHRLPGHLIGLWLAFVCVASAPTILADTLLHRLSSEPRGGRQVIVSPDHRHVYVRSLDGFDVYAREEATGELEWVSSNDRRPWQVQGPMIFSGDGRRLYSIGWQGFDVSPIQSGELTVFERDPEDGSLTERQHLQSNDFFGASSLALTSDERQLYVGVSFVWPGDRREGLVTCVTFDGPEQTPRVDFSFEAGKVEGVALSDGGRRLLTIENVFSPFAVDPRHALLRSFVRDRGTGRLTETDRVTDSEMLYANDLAVSPDGRFVYVAADGEEAGLAHLHNGRVFAFAYEAETGALTPIDTLDNSVTGLEQLVYPHRLSMRLDGEQLLVVVDDAILAFDRDNSTGALTLRQAIDIPPRQDAFSDAANLAYGPGGARLYAAEENDLVVYGQACRADDSTHCFHDQSRFQADVTWHDFQDRAGLGRTVPVLSDDSGLFWFFRDNNWEVLTKVLDGCNANGHFWVFGAATTNVGYTLRVTDTWTGTSRAYENPLGQASPAVVDNRAFATCDATPGPLAGQAPTPIAATLPQAESCGANQLCLRDGRFVARVTWLDFRGDSGAGQVAAPTNDTSGLFWFFREDNWEMLVKLLGGCDVNGHFWVLAAATTNVGYTLEVEDTQTGAVKTYVNLVGQASPATIDTRAFACE